MHRTVRSRKNTAPTDDPLEHAGQFEFRLGSRQVTGQEIRSRAGAE
jgi:hypothetical protein